MAQMNVFKFNYIIKGGNERQYDVTIVAETKEKGISLIQRRNGGAAIRVNSMSSVGVIHAVDDEIIDKFVNNNPKLKQYQEKIAEQNRILERTEHELDELQKTYDEQQRQPSSKDIKEAMQANKKPEKVYVCPECEHESTSAKGIKIHYNKTHNNTKENV